MSHPNWHGRVVAELRHLRSAGHEFDNAWLLATRAHPPNGNLQAIDARPRLFDEQGEMIDTQLSFFRRACEDAFYDRPNSAGQQAMVRFFRPEMLAEVDETSPATRSTMGGGRRFRQAA